MVPETWSAAPGWVMRGYPHSDYLDPLDEIARYAVGDTHVSEALLNLCTAGVRLAAATPSS